MGKVWNWIKGAWNWGKEHIGKPIWGGIKKVEGWLSDKWHGLDTWLKNASHIPVIGELASLARNNPLYGTINGIVDEADSLIAQGDQLGNAFDHLMNADSPDTEALKRAGGDILHLINATGGRLSDLYKTGGKTAGDLIKSGNQVIGQVIGNKPGEFIPNTTTPTVNTGGSMAPRPVQTVSG